MAGVDVDAQHALQLRSAARSARAASACRPTSIDAGGQLAAGQFQNQLAAAAAGPIDPLGIEPRSKRYDESLCRFSFRAVLRIDIGSNSALSISSSRVAAETSVSAPPITPPMATALGGVMGGAATEVTAATKDVLLESAEFDPMSIRARPQTQPAQRFVVSLRAGSRSGWSRLGQPPGSRIDFGTGRRRVGLRFARRGPTRRRRASQSRYDLTSCAACWESTCRRPPLARFWRPWAIANCRPTAPP